jgi:hypothetical protein
VYAVRRRRVNPPRGQASGLPASTTRFAGTERVPVGSAVCTGVDSERPAPSVSDPKKGCSSPRSSLCLRCDRTPDRSVLESRVVSTFRHHIPNTLWSFLLARHEQRECHAGRLYTPKGPETATMRRPACSWRSDWFPALASRCLVLSLADGGFRRSHRKIPSR